MANRPDRSRAKSTVKKKSQGEINKTKASGVLSLEILQEESDKIHTINVQLPSGKILEFYHLPMTVAQAEDFFSMVRNPESGASDIIRGKKNMLTDQLVNQDGSKFVESVDAWDGIDIQAVNAIIDAILESPRTDAGED